MDNIGESAERNRAFSKKFSRETLIRSLQGAERKVSEGAMTLLPQIDNIILEIMLFDYYEHRSSFLEIESILQPAGSACFRLATYRKTR